ncbi:uncharacterized protein [Palaemon carinicauda]|uniref:uncharacterized protein n=1 Tax=Palaemon carinicauda TaxID=392227 RepID=UPI0035B677D0
MVQSNNKYKAERAIGNCRSLEELKKFPFTTTSQKLQRFAPTTLLIINKRSNKKGEEIKTKVKNGPVNLAKEFKYLGEWYTEKRNKELSFKNNGHTGQQQETALLKSFDAVDINIANFRGQSYDNAVSECQKRRHNNCKAKLKVCENEVVGHVNEHTHAVDISRREVLLVKQEIKAKSIASQETAQQIIAQTVPQSISRRYKQAVSAPHPIPSNLADMVIPSEWGNYPGGSCPDTVFAPIYLRLTSRIANFADDAKQGMNAANSDVEDLLKLGEWSRKWQFPFNEGKCKVMHIGYNNQQTDYSLLEDVFANTLNLEGDPSNRLILARWIKGFWALPFWKSPLQRNVAMHPLKELNLRDNTESEANENEYGAVSSVVTYIYETYMKGCHMLLITDAEQSLLFPLILRSLRAAYIPEAILDLQLTSDLSDALLEKLRRGEEKVTCRVFLFDLTASGSLLLTLGFVDKVQLFLIRHTDVVFIGPADHMETSLQSRALRNSIRVLYLEVTLAGHPEQESLTDVVKSAIKYRWEDISTDLSLPKKSFSESVTVYCRCLFCERGEAGIRLVNKWIPKRGFLWNNSLFEDQFDDMNGHQLNIVQLDWYPFLDYVRDSDEPSTTVTPRDSVDMRMLRSIAKVRNFTYVMRVPWDEQWGAREESGNWTGMIGTLQHHKADFSMSVTYLRERLSVVDYTRVYVVEPLVLVLSKPRPKPPYLALIQPFEAELWVAVFMSTVTAGMILWTFQVLWSKASGKPGLPLDFSLLYTWSTIFEEPAAKLPNNPTGLIFIAWWWLYCTLITVVYKSSLVAHLSVPGKSSTIDSFEELLKQTGWTWGFENTHLASYSWMKYNDNPIIQQIFKKLEIQDIDEQMARVLQGKHVLIIKKFRIRSIVAASYTDKYGLTPVYYAKNEYFKFGHGWGFRRNAPYKRAIDMMKQRLIEAGLVYLWMEQMIGSPREEEECNDANCLKQKQEKENAKALQLSKHQESSGNVVLGMHHLQTIFYLLFLGLSGALMAFSFENLLFFCTHKSSSGSSSS